MELTFSIRQFLFESRFLHPAMTFRLWQCLRYLLMMGSKRKTHHSENHYPSALCSWPGLPLSFAVLERSLGVSRVERMLIVQMLYRFQIPPTFMNNYCHIPFAVATLLESTFDSDPSIDLVDVSPVADEIEFSWSSTVIIVKSFANWSAAIWWTYLTWSSEYFQPSERPVSYYDGKRKRRIRASLIQLLYLPIRKETTSGELSNLNRSHRTIQWVP